MKWTNKGHQFDEAAKIICDKEKEFYIWGAGETGQNFLKEYKGKFNIKGVIDSNKEIWNKKIEEFTVFSPDILDIDKTTKVIITVFSPQCLEEIKVILQTKNRIENINYFNHFLMKRIFHFYAEKKMKLMQIDLMLTNKCTLSCEKCLIHMPFFKNPKNYSFDEIKPDIDYIFQYVDFVGEFHLVGGEPLLCPDLEKFIEYLGERYIDKIGELDIVSNATIIPSEKLINIMKRYNVKFIMSDYSQSIEFNKKQKLKEIKSLLNKHSIQIGIRNQKEWFDYNGIYELSYSVVEEKLLNLFEFCTCVGKTVTIKDGKAYLCCRQAAAVYGGLFKEYEEDFLDITNYSDEKKKLFLEFSLGYTDSGYLEYCRTCYSEVPIYRRIIPAAKQLR